jgi:hypothetical protein|tara:strand:+ start:1212 stop:1649 length:438 start_codon:yes stop_codon:yes gene_type:complete
MNRWRQGVFVPKNPDKFLGTKAIYRSGLELKFFRFCDDNKNIRKWGSENVIVPYYSPLDNKGHKYYVDNYIEIFEGNTLVKYLVEIKHSRETKPPKTKYRNRRHLLYEQKTFIRNQAKWKAAREFSKKRGYKFIILTEKELIFKR